MMESQQTSLARGAAFISFATAISRVTGFVRVIVVAAAMGTTFLANTYQTANTIPNVVFELVAAGVLTSVFVPTFIDYLVKGDREGTWDAANALTSVALVCLLGLSVLVALAAPLLMRLLTLGVANDSLRADEIDLGTTFIRLFAPQVVFYGAGMIMTAALHAHRHFVLPAVAPILNNVVVIIVYLTYALMRGNEAPSVEGVSGAETMVLGLGTSLGVVAMTVCLVPRLGRLGWRFKWRFDTSHPAVRKGAKVGAWALGYAGGYQMGLIVVLLLANRVEGGVAAYQWAYTFFYLPHALFGVPIFHVLFPAMSEDASRGETEMLALRLREGLAMLTFILVPVAALMVAAAEPLAQVTLQYGAMTEAGASLTGRVIGAFAIGLPTYSVFLVLTRACYALGDARAPAIVNAACVALASILGAALFTAFTDEWAVAGLAVAHSIGFAVGAWALAAWVRRSIGTAGRTGLAACIFRSALVGGLALMAMAGVNEWLPRESMVSSALVLVATTVVGGVVYMGTMHYLNAPELTRLISLVKRSRG
jgi:putative peptidoglycan lipid II flippase